MASVEESARLPSWGWQGQQRRIIDDDSAAAHRQNEQIITSRKRKERNDDDDGSAIRDMLRIIILQREDDAAHQRREAQLREEQRREEARIRREESQIRRDEIRANSQFMQMMLTMLSASMGAQHTMPASNLRQDSGASSVREHPPAALSQSTGHTRLAHNYFPSLFCGGCYFLWFRNGAESDAYHSGCVQAGGLHHD